MKTSEEYKNIIMFVQGGISLVWLNAIIYILWSVGYWDMNELTVVIVLYEMSQIKG